MHRKLVAGFALLSALTLASAANTFSVNLYKTTVVNGTTFKAGECKLELKDNQVVLKQGKNTAEAPVKVENGSDKFSSTTVGYTDGNRIQEIRLGGTTTKVLFDGSGNAGTSAGR